MNSSARNLVVFAILLSSGLSADDTRSGFGDATTTAVITTPAVVVAVDDPITVSALITDIRVGHSGTIPTGAVTFSGMIGSRLVGLNDGAPVPLRAGVATLKGVVLRGLGAHTIIAKYLGEEGLFLASEGIITVSVSKR